MCRLFRFEESTMTNTTTQDNHYASAQETASVIRPATADEAWLHAQLDRLDPHRLEAGGAGDTPALIKLVFELKTDAERVREALKFYAEGDHFNFDSDAWDTVSGEPQNFWCDEAGTATVEDGTIAKLAIDAEMKGTP